MSEQSTIERMSPKRAKQLKPDEMRSIRGRFATHLEKLMQAANVTKEQLATGADLKEPAIRKWLRAEGLPDPSSMVRIAEVLGLDDYRMVLPPPPVKRKRK